MNVEKMMPLLVQLFAAVSERPDPPGGGGDILPEETYETIHLATTLFLQGMQEAGNITTEGDGMTRRTALGVARRAFLAARAFRSVVAEEFPPVDMTGFSRGPPPPPATGCAPFPSPLPPPGY